MLKLKHFQRPLAFLSSSLYDAERGEASPEFVPGRELDLLDAAGRSPPPVTPTIDVVVGAGSTAAPAASTPIAANAAVGGPRPSFGESVFAGGTYELEHPINHLGNDLRNDALREDEDSG